MATTKDFWAKDQSNKDLAQLNYLRQWKKKQKKCKQLYEKKLVMNGRKDHTKGSFENACIGCQTGCLHIRFLIFYLENEWSRKIFEKIKQ